MQITENNQITLQPHRVKLISKLKQKSLFNIIWYATFFVASIFCLIFIRPFQISLVVSVVSLWLYLLAVNLTAQGSIWGIVFNICSSLLYTTICIFTHVYGEVIINLALYVPLHIYAIFSFKNKAEKTNKLSVQKLGTKKFIFSILVTLTLFAIFSVALWFIPNQNLPILNALLISLTLMMLILRNGRFVESWLFNFFSNATSIALWVIVSCKSKEALFSLPSGALAGLASLINSIYGFLMWRNLFKSNETNFIIFKKRGNKIQTKNVIKIRKKFQRALSWRNEEKTGK